MKKQIQINEDLLWDYADGLLSEAEASAVAQQLKNSTEWQGIYKEIQAQKALLSEMPMHAPSADFTKNVMAAWETQQVKVAARKAKKDHLLNGLFAFIGTMLVGWLLIFLVALLRSEPSIDVPSVSIDTSFISHPSYLYTMAFGIMLVVLLYMEKAARARQRVYV